MLLAVGWRGPRGCPLRHNFWIPDELYARLQAAAAQAGVDEGKPISVSAWVRRTLEAALKKAEAR